MNIEYIKENTNLDKLVEIMVESDLNLANREKVLLDEGLIEPTWEQS